MYKTQYIDDSATRSYTDLDLNFMAHPISGDVPIVNGIESIKRSVKNLVLMEHYEKPFHPDVGCDIYKSLFENIEMPGVKSQLEGFIRHTITNYEPRASIVDIIVEDKTDTNGVNVAVIFTPENSPEPVTVNIFLKILR